MQPKFGDPFRYAKEYSSETLPDSYFRILFVVLNGLR
jgi:hypothetical protein